MDPDSRTHASRLQVSSAPHSPPVGTSHASPSPTDASADAARQAAFAEWLQGPESVASERVGVAPERVALEGAVGDRPAGEHEANGATPVRRVSGVLEEAAAPGPAASRGPLIERTRMMVVSGVSSVSIPPTETTRELASVRVGPPGQWPEGDDFADRPRPLAGDAPQVRRVEFQYHYEFRPRTWLGRFVGGTLALVAGAAFLALFAFSFAFVFLPLFALAFFFLLFLVIFQRRGEHKAGTDRSGHGRVRPADAPPDDLVEQQVVRGVLLRKIERR